MREIDGRKAEITSPGRRFPNYTDFADLHGYSDAAYNIRSVSPDVRQRPQRGDIVTLLVSGKHDSWYKGDTLWIVETTNGERHIFNEKGLRIFSEEITVLKDGSLSAAGRVVEREYREVKRKARVGERIKITNNGAGHGLDIGYICAADNEDFAEGWALFHAEESADPDYIVLEPTEIIRIDGKGDGGTERLRMVDRKAAVGERVIVVNPEDDAGVYGGYETGDIATITFTNSDSYGIYYGAQRTDGKGITVYAKEYRVLEPVESAEPAAPLSAQPPLDQAAATISALTAKVQALETQLRVAREDIVLIEEGVADDIARLTDRVATLEKAKQPVKVAEGPADDAPPSFAKRCQTLQEIRDEIVERAKADLEGVKKPWNISVYPQPLVYTYKHYVVDVEFVVNREKRTVVAIARWRHNGKIVSRGIAKCAPNDVFNAHIGRAIALRRALGLEIPAEYMNVPNPEEPRVGDVVFCHGLGDVFSLTGTLTERAAEFDGSAYGNNAFCWSLGGWIADNQYRVIDDSREEVGA